jgi:hypothetical protein
MLSELDRAQIAIGFAFKWFEIHADQRLKLMNFYITIIGFCLAGYVTALQVQNNAAATAVSGTLLFFTLCFAQLDRRTRQLTRLGEATLETLHRDLSVSGLDIVAKAQSTHGIWSYTQTFRLIFSVSFLTSLVGTIYPWISK